MGEWVVEGEGNGTDLKSEGMDAGDVKGGKADAEERERVTWERGKAEIQWRSIRSR